MLAVSLIEPELVSSFYLSDDPAKSENGLLFKPNSFACSLQNPLVRLHAALAFGALSIVSLVTRKSATRYLRDELGKIP